MIDVTGFYKHWPRILLLNNLALINISTDSIALRTILLHEYYHPIHHPGFLCKHFNGASILSYFPNKLRAISSIVEISSKLVLAFHSCFHATEVKRNLDQSRFLPSLASLYGIFAPPGHFTGADINLGNSIVKPTISVHYQVNVNDGL